MKILHNTDRGDALIRACWASLGDLIKIDLTGWRLKHKYSDKVIKVDDIELFFYPNLVIQVGDIEDLDLNQKTAWYIMTRNDTQKT